MNNNLLVLKHFVENKDARFTIKKMSEILNINYRIAHEEISKLEKEELITAERQGNSIICQFNYTYSSKIVEIEETRKQELFKNKDLKLVYKRIKEVKSPLYVLILFGSFADKTNKKGSDIDLCIIADNEKTIKEAHAILRITPLPVHLQDFTPEEFLLMLKSKEVNVGNEIVKNNIILHDIESFYELVNLVNR
jgi:predicted nucleotidyltransferase